jgi:hypothetical protein
MWASVRVTGLRESIRAMERAGADTSDLKDGFDKIGADVVRVSRRYAPRRTGALAGTIRKSRRKNGVVVSAGTARVPYASYNYYGSIHNPRPVRFIEVALDYVDVEAGVREAINQALTRAGL